MGNLSLVQHTALKAAQFGGMADMTPALEWLVNLTNARTRRPLIR